MAKKVILSLIDDLDGSEAAETVTFSFDDVPFEMELSEANAEQLRGILAPYKAAGRKISGAMAPKSSRSKNGATGVRKWAAENGIQVNPRGRVSGEILQRYAAAQS